VVLGSELEFEPKVSTVVTECKMTPLMMIM
jgi:hypothetical protein